jgi:assimilatory nitrate reductase catalytic subunit
MTTTQTHCPYCAFQCGLSVTTSGTASERLHVAGDATFPVNRGQVCIKGLTSGELIDHPARLRTPLLRGADGRLSPTSWEAALDFVARRLLEIRREHGAPAVAAFGSGALTNEKAYVLGKFARLALRTPNIDYNGRYCMASAAAGQNLAFGIDRGLPFPLADVAETDTLMLWGSNCAETMPPIMQWIYAQRDRGGQLVVVDPRATETARAASLHLQLTPGTDLALACAMLHIAIRDGLVDEAYVAARTEGWGDVRRGILTSDPAAAERITGVSVPHQIRAVRMLADVERSMVLSGRGPEQQSKGTDTVLALINLMLALGKVGKPFSGYGCITGQGNGQGGREHGQKADQLPGYRLIENSEHRAEIARIWGVDAAELPRKGKSAYELLDSLGPQGGIRALLVFGSNVAVASPNLSNVARKLRALDLLVVCDAFENETTAAAHVVLPVAQWAEEEGTLTNLEGRVILRQHVRAPPPGVRTDLDVMRELAERLGVGPAFAFRSPRDAFEELRGATAGARADYSGITYERIRAERGVFWPCPHEDHPGTPRLFAERFAHPSGRARFHPVAYKPAAELPDDEYPLYFTTGRYREHYNSGAQTRRVEALVDASPEPRLQMNPRLAAKLGVDDGDPVLVESRRGAIEFRVHVSGDIRVDTLFAPFHWGGKRAANALTIGALDPTSRMPEFKVCAVKARAATAGRRDRPAAGSRHDRPAAGSSRGAPAPLERGNRSSRGAPAPLEQDKP